MQKWGAFDNVLRTLPGNSASHLVMLLPLLLPLHTAAQRLGDVIPRVQRWFTCVPRLSSIFVVLIARVRSLAGAYHSSTVLPRAARGPGRLGGEGRCQGQGVAGYFVPRGAGQVPRAPGAEVRGSSRLFVLVLGVRSPFLCSGSVSPGSGWCRRGSGVACFVSTTRWSYVGQSMLHSSRPLWNKKTRSNALLSSLVTCRMYVWVWILCSLRYVPLCCRRGRA